MVSVKGTASELEKEILGGIIEPNCPNIEFKNITFDCKSIKDAAGHIFINQTYCNAVPVRHGHWIKISPAGIYECSECRKNVMTSDIEAYEYCHGCGARMDGESE